MYGMFAHFCSDMYPYTPTNEDIFQRRDSALIPPLPFPSLRLYACQVRREPAFCQRGSLKEGKLSIRIGGVNACVHIWMRICVRFFLFPFLGGNGMFLVGRSEEKTGGCTLEICFESLKAFLSR